MKKLIGSLCVLFLAACYSENEEELFAKELSGGISDTTEVKFKRDIQPIIRQNCSVPGCHVPGGTGVGLFEPFAEIKKVADNGKLRARVVDQGTMPPAGPLPANEIALIRTWIDRGAPNN